MHKRAWTQWSRCVLLLLGCILHPVVGVAASAEKATVYEDVELKLSVGPTEILVGQPVTMTISLNNRSTEQRPPVFSAKLQLPEGNDLSVYVTSPGEAEYRLEGAVEPGVYIGNVIEVPPGRTITHEMPLIYDKNGTNGYIFGKPGIYVLRAELRFSLSSNPAPRTIVLPATRIIVRAADGAAAEAFKQISDPASAKALQLARVTEDALRAKFTQVGDKYVDTPYGKAVARTVALSAAYAPKADVAKAIDVLRKYEKTYRDESDTDLIVYTIAGTYHIQQKFDLARDWLFYLTDKFQNSILVRKQDPLMKFYLLGPTEAAISFPWYLTEKPWIVPGAKPPTNLQPVQD